MPLPSPSSTVVSVENGRSFNETLTELRSIFTLPQVVSAVLEDMGLGSVAVTGDRESPASRVDFSVLHFIILPQKSAWLDFLLETDRASALKIYETVSGVSEASDADLEDMLRETMNMIHGALKIAFKKDRVDVIIPVVPQSIATVRLAAAAGGYSLQSRHVFAGAGIKLRLTMVARVSPVTRKQLSKFHLAEVLVEPVSADGNDALVLVKQNTMLNKRMLEKIHNLAECEPETKTHPVIEPSPFAALLPHD